MAIAAKQFSANDQRCQPAQHRHVKNVENSNTQLANSIIQRQAQIDLPAPSANAQAVQSASSTVAGMAGGGGLGGAGSGELGQTSGVFTTRAQARG
jgi:hypothetical protein